MSLEELESLDAHKNNLENSNEGIIAITNE